MTASGAIRPERAIGFFWYQFGPYHMDRCIAMARAFADDDVRVVGLELADSSHTYAWAKSGDAGDFRKVTLFPGRKAEDVGTIARTVAMIGAVRRHRIGTMFLSGYEEPANFLVAILMPLLGCRVYVVLDSKFDDKPRRLSLELVKALLMLPYRGGFASGRRAADYLRFLGFRRRPVTTGYDAVSIGRMRVAAASMPVSATINPVPLLAPLLVVARLVAKKNLPLAIAAFADYRRRGGSPRRLRLCGAGPLEPMLRTLAHELDVADAVDFLGFVDAAGVATEMSRAFALLLPSSEEQWGLVVNEALAFGLPVLTTAATGATDMLVTNWRNGFVLPVDDPVAWGNAMLALDADPGLHTSFRDESLRRAPWGDVAEFVAGAARLIAVKR